MRLNELPGRDRVDLPRWGMCDDDGLVACGADARRGMSFPMEDNRRLGCGRDCMFSSSNVISSIFVSSCVLVCVVFEPLEVLKLTKLESVLEKPRNLKPT